MRRCTLPVCFAPGLQRTTEQIHSRAALTPSHSRRQKEERVESERAMQHARGSPHKHQQQEALARAVERAQRMVCGGVSVQCGV